MKARDSTTAESDFSVFEKIAESRVILSEMGYPLIGPCAQSRLTFPEQRVLIEGKRVNNQREADAQKQAQQKQSGGTTRRNRASKQRRVEKATQRAEERAARGEVGIH